MSVRLLWIWVLVESGLSQVLIKNIVFDDVQLSKIVFFDNTTLYDDVTFLDQTVQNLTLKSDQQDVVNATESPEIPEALFLDLLLIADLSMYYKFSELYPYNSNSAYFALQDYLRVIFDQIYSIYYRLIFFEKTRIFLRLAGTLPIFRVDDCPLQRISNANYSDTNETTHISLIPDFSSVDALDSVHTIHDWLQEHKAVLPKYDHAIVFTRRDLMSQNNESATQGMAYVRAMCRGEDSVSVVEDVGGLTTVAIAAHEMAHSLGSFHDGAGNSSICGPALNFLMAPQTSGNELNQNFGNSFLLSECSLEHIEDFLKSSESDCLKKNIARARPDVTSKRRTKKAGEIFDRTMQCRIAFGNSYGKCSRNDFSYWKVDPCRRLWCQNRKKPRYSTCETKAFLPVMDGTACGIGKWCLRGDCIKNENYMTEECIDLREDYCRRFKQGDQRRYCVAKSIKGICCRTCQHYDPDVKKISKLRSKEVTRRLIIKTDL
ncbi:unnamed protein product [Bursaphelenchus okinawaensis]|uniref:Peptidase M12B domain-containing protein n=1 Tax=Bursaphelenchus okinawaensis TaxID=465554 RepID=A0A811LBE5_9BILA|nr:unnamed protein product [Bursaphelenchus okinawaensis]CAG9119902.1 unnamed protein product [Bursaphelenchus okinawaensis]